MSLGRERLSFNQITADHLDLEQVIEACAEAGHPVWGPMFRSMSGPSALSAAARLAVIVDLPTPPLPEATQITFLTCASAPSGSQPMPNDGPALRLR